MFSCVGKGNLPLAKISPKYLQYAVEDLQIHLLVIVFDLAKDTVSVITGSMELQPLFGFAKHAKNCYVGSFNFNVLYTVGCYDCKTLQGRQPIFFSESIFFGAACWISNSILKL